MQRVDAIFVTFYSLLNMKLSITFPIEHRIRGAVMYLGICVEYSKATRISWNKRALLM